MTPQWRPALAVLLPDSTVLVAGGSSIFAPADIPGCCEARYAELFDPTTGTFSETGGLQIDADSSFAITPLGKGGTALALVTGDADAAQLYQRR